MLNRLGDLISSIEVIIILLMGLYFTFIFKFKQFHFIRIIKSIFKGNEKNANYNSITLLLMVLGGRIGVGSIAGVALAIYLGGPGSIFWLLISSFITAILSYLETYLGHAYKIKKGDNYHGGPSYYLEYGLNKRWLGIIYAILIIFCYIGGFISVQSNTVTKSIQEIITINPLIVALLLGLITGYTIFGGLKKILKITSKLVIIMMFLYLLLTIYIIITNIDTIPYLFKLIITKAFNFKSFIGGFIPSLIIGTQRGIFANEAGLGTGSIAASLSNTKDYKQQGYVQIIGVYITTFLICLATSIIILTSNFSILSFSDLNGIEIVQYAFLDHIGYLGNIILFIFIFMFAFSTIITGYYYGEASLYFIIKRISSKGVFLIRLLTIFIVMLGCLISSTILWKTVDILTAFLVLINLYGIFKLKNKIM